MAWSFRRRIKIAPGVHINLSKSGVSTSVGPRGAKVTVGPKGTYLHTGIPGTGIYNRQKIGSAPKSEDPSTMPTSLKSPGGATPSYVESGGKGPSEKKGCGHTFVWVLCVVSAALIIGGIMSISETKKDIVSKTAQYEQIVQKNQNSAVESEIEGDELTAVPEAADVLLPIELEAKIAQLKSDLTRYYIQLSFLIAIFIFSIIYLIAQSSYGPKIASVFADEPSESNADADTKKNIDNIRNLVSKTNDPLKKKIINNHLGYLIRKDAESRLKPLVEKWAKKAENSQVPEKKEQYRIYKEQYDAAIAEANSLIFNVDEELTDVEKSSFQDFCDSFKALRSCSRTWQVVSSAKNTETKSSAATTVSKSFTTLKNGQFDRLASSYAIPTFSQSYGKMIYFYPRFVISGQSITDFEILSVDKINTRYKPTRFIEEGVRPADAKQVGTTYKYINKNGEADRRYSNNPVLPVLLYGDITLQPFWVTYQVSNSDAAMRFDLAFKTWQAAYMAAKEKRSGNTQIEPEVEDNTNVGGGVSEQFFNDLLSTAKKLYDFGNSLAEKKAFCKVVNDTVSGDINWNNKHLTEGSEKIPVFLWADVIHAYLGLGHDIDVSSNEGLGLLIFNTFMNKPDFQLEYRFLDFIRGNLKDATESYIRKTVASMAGDLDVFLLEVCLKDYDTQLHNQYVVLLYRFASLVAKADKTISAKEAEWLNKIMGLKVPDGVDDVIKPAQPIVEAGPVKNTSTKKPRSSAAKELESLIGLSSVKSEITSLTNYIKVQKMREEKGMKVTPVSLHCVFTGNPGTGKTTVARIVSEIYKELGLLQKGHLVETDRSGLVAEYVGQTAVKTNKIIDSALDGILFIDEAYSLVDGGNSDYGKEAISTLLKRMEDERDRLVVILAGYTNDMKRFIDSNPGLQSRFNRYIEFPDYSADELFQIFCSSAKKYEYTLTEDAQALLKVVFEKAVANKDKNFGNGRFVRNLFEKVIEHQANRLSSMAEVTAESLAMIEGTDIQNAL